MRIAVDLRSLIGTDGKISGVENYSLNIFNQLQNLAPNKVFGFYNNYKKTSFPKHLQHQQNLKSSSVPNKIFNLLLSFLNWPKFENLYGAFDLLWMPDLRPYALKTKTKMALTVHDLSPIMYPDFYSLKRNIWHKLINYKKSFQRADIIFAVSEYTKYDLIKNFGIAESKIKVIYPGINHDIFHLNLDQRIKHKVASKYDLPAKFILSLSTIEPRKNIIGTIKAFESLQNNDVALVIAGRPGWLYKDVLQAIKNSPKHDKIKMLGYIDEEDKPYMISLSEMLCFPSFYEGFGFQPLEAMACGVPAITSARTSMPEICGDAALLVEPDHTDQIAIAMQTILDDRAIRENLIKKGLANVQRFNWDQTAKNILNNLNQI